MSSNPDLCQEIINKIQCHQEAGEEIDNDLCDECMQEYQDSAPFNWRDELKGQAYD